MLLKDWQDIFHAIPEMERKHGIGGGRAGWVHSVSKDKCRVCVGYTPDGKPMLTPWAPYDAAQGGGVRSRSLLEKGENVVVHISDGDLSKVKVSRVSVQKSFPLPAHDDQIKNGNSGQLGKLRFSMEKAGARKAGANEAAAEGEEQYADETEPDEGESDDTYYTVWIAEEDDAPPAHEDQQLDTTSSFDDLAGDSANQKMEATPSETKMKMKIRLSEKGGFTALVGDKMRVTATKDGAKIEADQNFCAVSADKGILKVGNGDAYVNASGSVNVVAGGTPLVNKPWRLGGSSASNPVTNDNTNK